MTHLHADVWFSFLIRCEVHFLDNATEQYILSVQCRILKCIGLQMFWDKSGQLMISNFKRNQSFNDCCEQVISTYSHNGYDKTIFS